MTSGHAHVWVRKVDESGPYLACSVWGCGQERDYPDPSSLATAFDDLAKAAHPERGDS